VAVVIGALAVSTGCAHDAAPQRDRGADRAAVESALRLWPQQFNDRNLPAVCGLFADDVVLSYPDSPDRGHDAFCAQMKKLFEDPARRYTYAEPDIEEILVDGDLGAVKLIWTLTVADPSGKVLDTVVEDGVDVFQRQADGSWKIRVSHAFTRG